MTKKKTPQTAPENENAGLMFDVGTEDAAVQTSTAVAVKGAPAVEEIEAEALMPGIECPFTDGCKGKIKIHTDITRSVEEGDKIVQTRVQQYRCGKCNVIAKGHKVVGRSQGRKFFNRVTGRPEE